MNVRVALAGLVAIVMTVVDLATKLLAERRLKDAEPVTVIPGFWDFRYAENRDVGFSLLSSIPYEIRQVVIFILVTIGLGIALRYGWTHRHAPKALFGAALVTAGALGNLINRAMNGYVIDFVLWYVGDFHWPVFNVADVCVVIGVALLLWYELPQPAEPASPA